MLDVTVDILQQLPSVKGMLLYGRTKYNIL